jgi:hypothetical protein
MVETVTVPLPCVCSFPARKVLWALRRHGFLTKPVGDPTFRWSGTYRARGRSSFHSLEMVHYHSFHLWKVQEALHGFPVQVASMSDVVSVGGSLLRLGIGLGRPLTSCRSSLYFSIGPPPNEVGHQRGSSRTFSVAPFPNRAGAFLRTRLSRERRS